MKTTTSRYPELRDHLLAEHPWDNPEITAMEIVGATEAYLDWLKRTVEPTY